jgi:isoleucyl-tRNA synthetase
MAEVSPYYNPKAIEKKVRDFWEKNRIPQKLAHKKGKKFYLLDGPPYVNQIPHVGHIKTTTMKDIWAKFKLMQGFRVWLQPGFDCHGLPIETMIEKELGITSKKQIEEMGIKKFCNACKEHAEDKKDEWLQLYKSLGAWRGWFEPYLTYKNYYIQSGWWTVKKLFEKGMLVLGEKPTFWCSRCETALAGYEVTDSYRDVKDPSIYVKFQLKEKTNEFIVVWTTTPWTLISNVAITVHPNEYYVKVKAGKEILIFAEKRLQAIEELTKQKYEIIEKFLGKELEGLGYNPLFKIPAQEKIKKNPNAHRIILSIPVMKKGKFEDFVNMEEGSGCVHTAPGHGPEDYEIGKHYNLPLISPINDEGKFSNEAGEFRDLFVKDADKLIIEKLKKKNLLLYFTWIIHPYPLCWRCRSPLIYRLSKQWFFKVDKIKQLMIKENKKVRWLPGFGKEWFNNWLIGATDWCISRQRYWGIPLPIWICEKCEKIEVIGSLEELRKKAIKPIPKEIDLHRHEVDKIEIECKNCKSTMRRVRDTMDVWFDSGIAPWASLGYPFKNKDLFEEIWPVNLVCESQDQIRGWFYSLMFCSAAAFETKPYSSVSLMGWVLDEKGEKMSKSLGNVIWARDAIENLGADVLRLYYCWEVPPWQTQKFSFRSAEEVRRALNIFWNCFSFFKTYSFPNFKPKIENLLVEDKWLISKLNSLIEEVASYYENFEFHRVGRKLVEFILNDLSRFYIKLIRDRVWISKKNGDKEAALSTLYLALTTLSKLIAPIAPFISEEIYQDLVRSIDKKSSISIHLTNWPKPNKNLINKKLEEEMEIVRDIIDSCYSARQDAKIKLRWPVKRVVVVSTEKKIHEIVKKFDNILKSMCNAKSVLITEKLPEGEFSQNKFDFGLILVDKIMDEELKNEALIRELIRKIQDMRKKAGLHVTDLITLYLNSNKNEVLEKNVEILKEEVSAKEIIISEIKGEVKGELEFEDVKIDIAFNKT